MKMKLFDAAYLRMTAWYVALIMAISLLFSFWVYNEAQQELLVGLGRVEQIRQLDHLAPSGFRSFIDDRLDDSRQRLVVRLVALNTVVLVLGAAASYGLARRTMRPIEESVEAQHRFTADASHELRTPLAAMKTEIEVGLRDAQLTKQDAVQLLRSNLEEIDRLGTLADGLLALTQSDAAPVTARSVALEDVAGKVAKRLRPLADAQAVELKLQLEPVVVKADDAAVDKIIGILLDNAVKYSPAKTTVALKTYRKDGYGYVEVKDQGIGIKAGELPHVFDRFYRADTSRSKMNVLGHGLGLSIAHKLAEDFDGTIQAASAIGKGSTFTVKLPAA